MQFAYIDPNTIQQVFGGPLTPIMGWIAFILMTLLWPVRKLFFGFLQPRYLAMSKKMRISILIPGALVTGAGMGLLTSYLWPPESSEMLKLAQQQDAGTFERVLVLGMDGLDAGLVEAMMARGELPNFAKLAKLGGYSRLETSNPPESPVAWSTIATGCGPKEHGIYDFLHRDPKNYIPFLSLRKSSRGFFGTRYEKARKRDGFWAYTSAAKIPTTVIRWPVSFPAEKVNGRFLSGFGVPDLLGGEGKYTHFCSEAIAENDPSPRNVVFVKWNGNDATTHLQGPARSENSFSTVEMTFQRRGDRQLAITIAGSATEVVTIGQWTPLISAKFSMGLTTVHGRVKFYLSELTPMLRLTASPIHMDATKQAFAISCPDCFGGELEMAMGPIHTLGMPEQIHPLSHCRYDYDAFLAECRVIDDERRKMLDLELARFERGLLAFVFDGSDRIQHALWATRDPEHPAYNAAIAAEYKDVIPSVYREMDALLGSVLDRIDDRTALIVLSDHGFNSFRRAIHVNRWLIDNGYLTLKSEAGRDGREIFRDVDWSKTKAYALGFTSIYLNLRGREGEGIVNPSDAEQLRHEITTKLKAWKDPTNGKNVIHQAYTGPDIYAGAADCPDIVLGLNPGFRVSWQTALGGAPAALIEDNRKRWSGDHLIDPSFVPGVLFSNQPIVNSQPRLPDIAPTVLRCFGLKPPEHMTGRPLF
jgi:predicted AlkP superfamily phosphohydrolase/phosphomutase